MNRTYMQHAHISCMVSVHVRCRQCVQFQAATLRTHGGFYHSGAHPGKPVYLTKRSIVYQLPFSVVLESKL